jgi:hypothetical protein
LPRLLALALRLSGLRGGHRSSRGGVRVRPGDLLSSNLR